MWEGERVLSFRKKRKNQRKVDWLFSRICYLVPSFYGAIYGKLPCFLATLGSPRASGGCFWPCLWLTQTIILLSFGIPRMIFFCLGRFPPAPCSPPLGGSDVTSAVRFTPAGKYGGRENWLYRRETRCMSGHPCRAHHKLKWARKGQSGLEVLYELIPRSESSKTIIAVKLR